LRASGKGSACSRARARLGLLAMLAACGSSQVPRDAAPPVFRGQLLQRFDLEGGEAGPWSDFKLPGPEALTIAADDAPSAHRFARFRLRRSDPIVSDGHRSELQLDAVGFAGEPDLRWYGFRMRLPSDWTSDRARALSARTWASAPSSTSTSGSVWSADAARRAAQSTALDRRRGMVGRRVPRNPAGVRPD
jgi:hypothetical protein